MAYNVFQQNLNSNIPYDDLLLNFCSAFDKAVISILLTKLMKSASLHGWLAEFLRNGTHSNVSNKEAQLRPILSLLVWCRRTLQAPVFINDLSKCTELSDLFLFADDSKLVGILFYYHSNNNCIPCWHLSLRIFMTVLFISFEGL